MKTVLRFLAVLLALVANRTFAFTGTYSNTPAGHTVGISWVVTQGTWTGSGWQYACTIGRTTAGVNPDAGAIRFRGTGVTSDLATTVNVSTAQNAYFTWNPGVTVTMTPEVGWGGTTITGTPVVFVTPATPPTKKTSVYHYENPTDFPGTIKLYKRDPATGTVSATPFATQAVAAWQTLDLPFKVTDGSDVVARVTYADTTKTAGVLVASTGNTYTTDDFIMTNPAMTTDSGTASVVGQAFYGNVTSNIPTNLAAETAAPIGGAGAQNIFTSSDTANTAALSIGVYSSGLNKQTNYIVAGLQNVVNAVKSSGGGGGTTISTTAMETKLDTVAANQNKTHPGGVANDLSGLTYSGALSAANTSGSALTSAADTNMAATKSTMDSNAAAVASADTISATGDLVLGPDIEIHGKTFTMRMLDYVPWFPTACNCVREAFLWGMALLFCKIISENTRRSLENLSKIPQTDTTPEVAQNWIPLVGAAKQLTSVLTVMAAIAACIAAVITVGNSRLGAITGSWTISTISHVGTLVVGSGDTQGFKAIDMVFPVRAAVQFALSGIGFTWLQMSAYAIAAAYVKSFRI